MGSSKLLLFYSVMCCLTNLILEMSFENPTACHVNKWPELILSSSWLVTDYRTCIWKPYSSTVLNQGHNLAYIVSMITHSSRLILPHIKSSLRKFGFSFRINVILNHILKDTELNSSFQSFKRILYQADLSSVLKGYSSKP